MTSTLGKLIAGNYTLTAYCERCRHAREIDLEALAARLGEGATIQGSADCGPARIAGKPLRCSASDCRSYNTSVRIRPETPRGQMVK